MSKRFLFAACALLVIGALAALFIGRRAQWVTWGPDVRVTEKDLREAALKRYDAAKPPENPEAPLDANRPVRLAIGGFGFPDADRSRTVGDLIVTEVAGAEGLELVERQSLDAVLRELELSLSGLVRAKDAVRVGQLVRADWFLLGGVSSATQGNAVIARMVDARTGIMRDVAVIGDDGNDLRLGQALAGFVRQCRRDASSPKSRTFLAVGSFADYSVNDRQADFPAQLRAALTAAFEGSGVTLLERDHVSTLLREVRLDLAGLTDHGTNRATKMQSAFWVVDGYYQSVETSGFEVELMVRVKPLFGAGVFRTFRDKPGEVLVRQLKGFVDGTMARNGPSILAPTRENEIGTQMGMGKDLYHLNHTDAHILDLTFSIDHRESAFFDPKQVARLRRIYEEAIRAFESVLLLDPENRSAKMYLAACLRESIVGRREEARDLYKQILSSPQKDEWSTNAMRALAWTYRWNDPLEAAKWFHAAGAAPQENDALFDAIRTEEVNEKTMEFVEARLVERIHSSEQVLMGRGGGLDFWMDGFMRVFGTNRVVGAERLVALLPKLQKTFPNLAPHLLAAVVSEQVETNAPVIAEFLRSFQACVAHPENVKYARYYFEDKFSNVYNWCVAHKHYSLAVELGEAKRQLAVEGEASYFDRPNRVRLAFAYMAVERWQDALGTLGTLGNEPVEVAGPWGYVISTHALFKAAAECRAKLGLPPVQDKTLFDLGPPCLHLHNPTAFATEGETIWLASGSQLIELDAALKTNSVHALPNNELVPVTSLCVSPQRIWIGTEGAGLIDYDKVNGRFHRLTEKDGLLMDDISVLHLQRDWLWIGYGSRGVDQSRGVGGLGLLDLPTHRLSSLSPKLADVMKDVPGGPPRRTVVSIADADKDDVWVLADSGTPQKFRNAAGAWTSPALGPPFHATCLAVGAGRLFVGRAMYEMGKVKSLGGVQSLGLNDGVLRSIGQAEGLPSPKVTILTVVDRDLWVGGEGFVAVVDLAQWKTRHVCYVSPCPVDQIEVAAGFVWVKFGGHLYRAPWKALQ